MKFSQLLALTCVVLMHTSRISAQSSDFYLTLDSVSAAPNQVVCLHMKAYGFYKIVAFQFGLEWDDTVVDFDHTQNYGLLSLSGVDFLNVPNACLVCGWSDPSGIGVSIPDGETLVEICFNTLSLPGANSNIALGFDCLPAGAGSHLAVNAYSENVWNLNAFGNGQITIMGSLSAGNKAESVPSFTLQPNPTHSFSSVLVDIPYVGAGQIQVSNLSGQLIWKEAVQCQPGQNRFDIPAEALKQPGLYQVSLITEKGIITQLLCVTAF